MLIFFFFELVVGGINSLKKKKKEGNLKLSFCNYTLLLRSTVKTEMRGTKLEKLFFLYFVDRLSCKRIYQFI